LFATLQIIVTKFCNFDLKKMALLIAPLFEMEVKTTKCDFLKNEKSKKIRTLKSSRQLGNYV
jgi:hypothetical protein